MSACDKEFTELLSTADQTAVHLLIHIMRKEARRIGLDLSENLQRLGIERGAS